MIAGRRAAKLLVAISLAGAVAGCAANVPPGFFDPPEGARLMGGGHNIGFEAPGDGTVYLVNHGKLALSKTVTKGEKLQWLGSVQLSQGQYWELDTTARLYFEPLQAGTDRPEKD